MKKIYLSVFLAGATLLSFAQSKIDLVGQGLLKQQSFIEKLSKDALLKTEKDDNQSIQPFDTNTDRIVVLVDLEKANVPFTDFSDKVTAIGTEMSLSIHVMHEDIFNSMHRI